MTESAREKISMFSHVDIDHVICLPDVNNLYRVPLILFENRVAEWLAERLSLKDISCKLSLPSISIISEKDDDEVCDERRENHIMQKWIELYDRFTYDSYL